MSIWRHFVLENGKSFVCRRQPIARLADIHAHYVLVVAGTVDGFLDLVGEGATDGVNVLCDQIDAARTNAVLNNHLDCEGIHIRIGRR